MSIFKREKEPPFNPAAVARAATAPVTTVATRKEPEPTVAGPVPPAPAPAAVATSEPPVAREAAAVVDRKTEVTGALHSSGNVLIEGCFHGEVEANETVWVERGAQSDGQLRATDAVISGAVDGQIDCARRLQIAASAVVSGEIKTPVLVIEDGATVNCRFSMARQAVAYGGLR